MPRRAILLRPSHDGDEADSRAFGRLRPPPLQKLGARCPGLGQRALQTALVDGVLPTTVLLIDDDDDARYAARLRLDLDDEFRVVAEGVDGLEAVNLARACRPDIVLLDLEMPWLHGAEAVPLIQRASPSSVIVIWTVAPESARADAALELGASVVLDKGDIYDRGLPRRIAAAYRRVLADRRALAADVATG